MDIATNRIDTIAKTHIGVRLRLLNRLVRRSPARQNGQETADAPDEPEDRPFFLSIYLHIHIKKGRIMQLEEHPTVQWFRGNAANRTDPGPVPGRLDAGWLRQLCL